MSLKENRLLLSVLFILSLVISYVFPNRYVFALILILFFIMMINIIYFSQKNIDKIEEGSMQPIKEANVRAEDAFETLTNLINVIPSPLVYINQRGDFEVMNVNFAEMLNTNDKNVYDVEIDSPLRQTILDAFLNQKQFTKQFHYNEIDYQVLSAPILKSDKFNGCMLVFQDITNVVDGENMQKRFIADASHELRTPITSIKGMSEIMLREDFNDEVIAKEFLTQIEVESERLEQIVNDLLLQSRLKSNKIYLEKSYFNLKQFIEGVTYEKRQDLKKANITVSIHCDDELMIKADQFRLSQVFINLFNNAINYSKDGNIDITCSSAFGFDTIEFKDNGDGIPSDILPFIFDRFYKRDFDRARMNSGSGLGLAISKSIIENHGGVLTVDSVENVGTTFTIKLES